MKYPTLIIFIVLANSQSFAGGSTTTVIGAGAATGAGVGAAAYMSMGAYGAALDASAQAGVAAAAAGESATAAADESMASMGTATKFMHTYCGTAATATMCAVGASIAVSAITDALESDKDHNIANGITPGSPQATTPAYNAIQPQVAAAQQIASGMGTTLGQLASQAPTGAGAGGSAGGSGQVGASGSGLPGYGTGADGQGTGDAAGVGKSGFRVSSVATDGGGGGGGARNNASADGAPDINGLLAGLNGQKNSAGGLQKSLNGEPIGVASDNIFTKITQAYQAKTTAQTFLPTSN